MNNRGGRNRVHIMGEDCSDPQNKHSVSFVRLEGDEKEKVVVIGEGVDAVKLTNCLRKKVGQTDILHVAAA
ncbi:hypothetical protein K1719_037637 [Acacia pycnantha]|nr:hypothetical protein K1719_037637 [Acacia pycnantha]